jgi:NAD(P)H-dependent FMN reductase
MKIGIIVGSTRPGRKGRQVAEWILEQASVREAATYELVDLLDFNLPVFDEANPPGMAKYEHEHTKKWSAAVAQYDGFVFVTPEYNHAMPASLKNALDYLVREWAGKGAACVSYGFAGGVRAVEGLRCVLGQLRMADVSANIGFSMMDDFADGTFAPREFHVAAATLMFDQLESWTGALIPLRAQYLQKAG